MDARQLAEMAGDVLVTAFGTERADEIFDQVHALFERWQSSAPEVLYRETRRQIAALPPGGEAELAGRWQRLCAELLAAHPDAEPDLRQLIERIRQDLRPAPPPPPPASSAGPPAQPPAEPPAPSAGPRVQPVPRGAPPAQPPVPPAEPPAPPAEPLAPPAEPLAPPAEPLAPPAEPLAPPAQSPAPPAQSPAPPAQSPAPPPAAVPAPGGVPRPDLGPPSNGTPPAGSAVGSAPGTSGSRTTATGTTSAGRPRRAPSPAGQDPVSMAIQSALRPGVLAFNPPDEMTQGRAERVEVAVARSAELIDELVSGLRGRGQVHVEKVPTSAFMSAELRGESFLIRALSPAEQIVAPAARWEFDVIPRHAGVQTLTLCVSMRFAEAGPLAVPGSRIAVPVVERQIRIKVSVGYGARSFAAKNWQWLVGTAIAIVGAIAAILTVLH